MARSAPLDRPEGNHPPALAAEAQRPTSRVAFTRFTRVNRSVRIAHLLGAAHGAAMRGKQIVYTALIAFAVVVAYEKHRTS